MGRGLRISRIRKIVLLIGTRISKYLSTWFISKKFIRFPIIRIYLLIK